MDWATRHMLAWQLSNTMDASFCVSALDEALGRGTPEIFNTDQGSQFTSEAFAERVLGAEIRFSMDGRGRYLDNTFIERLWRSLKYEAIHLRELEDGVEARRVVGDWMDFYNEEADYSEITRAHEARLDVSLEGDLVREGQRWRLRNPRGLAVIEDDDET